MLLSACVVAGQTIDVVNSRSQPNQWNNLVGTLTPDQAALWSTPWNSSAAPTTTPAPQSIGSASPPFSTQPPQTTPAFAAKVGTSYIQTADASLGRPQSGYPTTEMGAIQSAAVPVVNNVLQTPQSTVQLVNESTTSFPNLNAPNLNAAWGNLSEAPAQAAVQRPTIGQKAATELKTAMRQLNPFSSRESTSAASGLSATNRNLFTEPIGPSGPQTSASQVSVPQVSAPTIPQFVNSPQSNGPSNVVHGPQFVDAPFGGPPSFPPPAFTATSQSTPHVESMNKAALEPGFKAPPLVGTPLMAANNGNKGSLPIPIHESPFGSAPQQVPQSQWQSPTPSTPGQANRSPVFGAPPSTATTPNPNLKSLVPQAGTVKPSNTQVIAPYSYSDPLTAQMAQRDIDRFVAGSVNNFRQPSAPCDPVLAQPCGPTGCGSLCGCRPPCSSPLWLQWETLIYYIDGYRTPPLLTRSPEGTTPTDIGILGRDTTETIFGGNSINDGIRSAGRLRAGWWFDKCRKFGLDGEFFALTDGGDDDFRTRYGGTSTIARPFFNESTGAQDAEVLNMPGLARGVFDANLSTRIYSGAPTMRFNMKCCSDECDPCNPCQTNDQTRVDLLAGYRYFHLGETLQLYETFEPDNNLYPEGTTYELFDEYRTRNDFHGVEIGFDWKRQHNRWYSELLGLVALGQVKRTVDINGRSRVTVPGLFDTEFNSGFYTEAKEQGRTTDRSFAVLPQARVKIGYCITPTVRVHVGYDILYLSKAVRPGTQIDPSINPDTLLTDQPTPDRLQRDLPDDDFWMQGVSIGAIYNF